MIKALARACAAALLVSSCASAQGPQDCTAAVISPAASAEGRPMLWKNRDTANQSNKVVYVKEQPYAYLAVVDADAADGRDCYGGINSAGFAIMNTMSYNLPAPKGEARDQEGILMGHALRSCRTVEDFEAFLKAALGPSLGVTSNYCVLDGTGKAFIFETHSRGYHKLDAAAAPEGYLPLTNFSRSGKADHGAGYLRFDRAVELLRRAPGGKFSPAFLLRTCARDTGHSLLGTPSHDHFKDFSAHPGLWIHGRHTINRWDTATAMVLVGARPGDPGSRPMMWILTGEPLVSIALPLWVDAGCSPAAFHQGVDCPLWTETLRLRHLVRPFYGIPEKQEYLEATRLDNREGTGFLPRLLAAEDAILGETAAFLEKPRSAKELADFQERMATRALEVLKGIR